MCAGLKSRVRAPICGPRGADAGVADTARTDLGTPQTRGRTGSPARSRAATTRRAAPRRPWPDRALALLRATCRRLLRAARRLPRARPMGGRASLRGGAALHCWGKSAAPDPVTLSHQSLHAPPPPPGRPQPGFLHLAVCGSGHRPASPRTVQRAGSQAEGGVWGQGGPGGLMEPRLSKAESIQSHWQDRFQSPQLGAGNGFLNCLFECRISWAWNYCYSMKGLWFLWR